MSKITENVRSFLQSFLENVRNGQNVWQSYRKFGEITEQTFKVSQWPSDKSVIAALKINATDDYVFLTLYRELYYRHTFTRCEIRAEDLIETLSGSWTNYINLFNLFEQSDRPDTPAHRRIPEIPTAWLWELVDSFASQFQYFHSWKFESEHLDYLHKMAARNPAYKAKLQSIWNIQTVLRYLMILLNAAKIPLRYNPPIIDDESYVSNTTKMLGFFCLIALLRVHTITGDYHTAIAVMEQLDLKRKSALTRIKSFHITAQYYLSFCYLMTRRLAEAHSMLTTMLTRYQREATTKKRSKAEEETEQDLYRSKYLSVDTLLERSYAVLAIVHSLFPQKMDEKLIGDPMSDLFSRELDRIEAGNRTTRKENYFTLFLRGAPDLVNTCDLWTDTEYYQSLAPKDLRNHQFNGFFRTICLRHDISRYSDELKLYRSIPLRKLGEQVYKHHVDSWAQLTSLKGAVADTEEASVASLTADEESESKTTETDTLASINAQTPASEKLNAIIDEKDFQRQLLQLKCKMRQYRDDIPGNEWGSTTQIDFFIKNDVAHVRESQPNRLWRYSNYFIRSMREMSDVIDNNQ